MKTEYTSSVICESIWPDFTAHFKSSTTKGSYESDLEEYMEYIQKDFLEADKNDVKLYYGLMQKEVEKGKIKPATMAKKFRELHSFSEYICENRRRYGVAENYQDIYRPYLKFLAKQEKLAHSVPVEHIDRLLMAAQKDWMAYTIIVLLHRTGISSTEITQLTPEDFTAYDNGVYVHIKERREPGFIPEDAFIVLEKYMAVREPNEFLFYNSRGGKLNTMYISRMLKKYALLAGIPSYSANSIRNTCGFTMFAYGAKPDQVARQMGVTAMQIKRYKGMAYKDNLKSQACNLVKLRVEPPV